MDGSLSETGCQESSEVHRLTAQEASVFRVKETHTLTNVPVCSEEPWQVSPVKLVLVTFFSKGFAGLGQHSGGEHHEKLSRRYGRESSKVCLVIWMWVLERRKRRPCDFQGLELKDGKSRDGSEHGSHCRRSVSLRDV